MPKKTDVIVRCTNPRCAQAGVEQTVPGALELTKTVIATYNLCCALCGSQLEVVGSAP